MFVDSCSRSELLGRSTPVWERWKMYNEWIRAQVHLQSAEHPWPPLWIRYACILLVEICQIHLVLLCNNIFYAVVYTHGLFVCRETDSSLVVVLGDTLSLAMEILTECPLLLTAVQCCRDSCSHLTVTKVVLLEENCENYQLAAGFSGSECLPIVTKTSAHVNKSCPLRHSLHCNTMSLSIRRYSEIRWQKDGRYLIHRGDIYYIDWLAAEQEDGGIYTCVHGSTNLTLFNVTVLGESSCFWKVVCGTYFFLLGKDIWTIWLLICWNQHFMCPTDCFLAAASGISQFVHEVLRWKRLSPFKMR